MFIQVLVCCLLPIQEGFGQATAKVNPFVVPQQSYAAIDISGDSTGGLPVTLLALDDDNHAAFAFNTLPELYSDYFGYYYLGDCVVKLWSNGALTDGHTFPLTVAGSLTFGGNDPLTATTHYFQPSFITSTGTVFGSAGWEVPQYDETNDYLDDGLTPLVGRFITEGLRFCYQFVWYSWRCWAQGGRRPTGVPISLAAPAYSVGVW